MARSFGRVLASIWDDEDFRALTPTSRLMYVFLISQPDLDHSGVIPLRVRRWAIALDLAAADINNGLKEMAGARFVALDEDEEELLVRSLIRRDEIWRQPNVFKSAAASAVAARSAVIKRALLAEVRRLDLSGSSKEIQRIRQELLIHLEPFGNPSPTPPDPSSGQPWDGAPDGVIHRANDIALDYGSDAGQNPSGTPRQPFGNPSAGGTGKGDGYGPVLEVSPSPIPHSPSPSADAGRPSSAHLSAVPDVKAEEGESFQDIPPDIGALVAEVRAVRVDWSTRSIRRALDDPAVRERPWPVVRRAILAVAADKASKHPGRLSHDGPWWHQSASEEAGPDALPWCGQCGPNRRLEDPETRDDAGPCPDCHPSNARAS